jgi:Asparagine synthase
MRHMRPVPYAKAFVGVMCADDHGEERYTLASDVNREPVTSIARTNRFKLHLFGRTTPTIDVFAADDCACVKGRPFALQKDLNPLALNCADLLRQLRELDGRFSLCVRFDQTLVLATDLIGSSAIFYAIDSFGLVFATHFGLLMRSLPNRPPLDNLGVASILAGSCCVNGRTPFAHIRRLEAGQCLIAEYHDGQIAHRVETYLDPVETLLDSTAHDTKPIDAFEASLVAAVQREVATGDHGLMLSGGHDSRAIAQALLLSGHTSFGAFTFGEWRSTDVRQARRFAQDVGLDHALIDYHDWEFQTYAPMITALCHGTAGIQTAHYLVGYERAAAQMNRGLVGYLGDALTGAHVPRGGESIADRIFAFRSRWHPAFESAYRDELAELESAVNERWSARPELSLVQRALLTDLTIRQATRISATFDLCEWVLPLSFPFYSRQFMRVCFNLPSDLLSEQRLYRAWIDSSFTRIRGARPRTPSTRWVGYESIQWLLDRVQRTTGLAPMVDVVDWNRRVERSRGWLATLSEEVEDARLRRVFRAQVHSQHPDRPALLAAGLVLAGA